MDVEFDLGPVELKSILQVVIERSIGKGINRLILTVAPGG